MTSNIIINNHNEERSTWLLPLHGLLNKKVSIILRDTNIYIGILSTFDNFGNIVLFSAQHKIIATDGSHSLIDCNVMLIRGESIIVITTSEEVNSKNETYDILEKVEHINPKPIESNYELSISGYNYDDEYIYTR